MGVGALAASAVRLLKRRYSECSIALLDYGKTQGDELTAVRVDGDSVAVSRINLRFSWKLFLRNNVFFLAVLAWLCRIPILRRQIVRRNQTLRAIDESKIAFALSGGDSFSDIYGLERFIYVTLPQLLVIWLGKDLVMLPQTIGPFNRTIPRRIASGLMEGAKRVYSRDIQGLEVAQAVLGESDSKSKIQFGYDLGFILEPRPPADSEILGISLEDTGKEIVGLNVSGLLMMGGYDQKNMFGLKVDYGELVDSILRLFCEREGVCVLLVPHVFGAHSESDQSACRSIYNDYVEKYPGMIGCVASRHDQHEIKHIIGRCDFLIGARMHACIAALSQGVPAIGVAYSRKFAGVLESVGAGNLVVDARTMDMGEIVDTVSARFADRQRLSENLEAVMPEVKRTIFGMLDDLDVKEYKGSP